MSQKIVKKIKNFSRFVLVAGIIASIVWGIIIGVANESLIDGLSIVFGGILSSLCISLLLDGYGEIIQRLINIDTKLTPRREEFGKFDLHKFKRNEPVENIDDKEVLYQFALEQIEKKQYAFARDSLKRIAGYKDSDEILAKIESL